MRRNFQTYFDTAVENAHCTSHRTQNDLINLSAQALREDIIKAANNAIGFSVIADETADISGTEQLSLGLRFFDTLSEKTMIREEFLGVSPLKDMDVAMISDCIILHLFSSLIICWVRVMMGVSQWLERKIVLRRKFKGFTPGLPLFTVPRIDSIS